MTVSRKQIKAERKQRRSVEEQSRLVDTKIQQRRKRTLLAALLGSLLLFAVAFAVIVTVTRDPAQTTANESDVNRRAPDKTSIGFADQGNQHIQSPNSPHVPYNSSPPTSGPHLSGLAPTGWHDQPVQVEQLVHNLEDGHIVIYYKPSLDPADKERLQALVQTGGEKIVAAPYNDMDTNIALTAWTRMDKLDGFDEQRIRNFIQAYQGIDHHK